MACGKFQGLLIKKARARSAKDLAAARRALRVHVMNCAVCLKKAQRLGLSR